VDTLAGAAAEPTPEQAAQPPQTPTDAVVPPQTLTVDERIERLLASQEALTRRVDSLTQVTAPASADTARSLGGSGEVLGEARQQVRNFGVAVVWSIVVLVLFSVTIRGLVWLLDALAERNASRRLFYKRLVPIVRIVLWVFAAYLIIRVIFRVDYQGLVAAAAAVGVAVGFAAQDLLKNLFGGLILVFDQPFQVGDKIHVGGTYGEVVSIGLRSTRIVTPDDNLVSVPNAEVVDHQVANANAGQLHCQVVTDLYLPGWADEAQAKRIAFDAAASSKYVYLNKPIVVLVSDVFKETFLTQVRVKAYVMDPRLEFLFQSDVTERARSGFREAGLLKPEHMRERLVERSAVGASADVDPDPDRDAED
jgi:small-conductance mechanosensitive channel